MANVESLKATTTQFVESLLGNKKKHTLCINIEDPAFTAETFVAELLEKKGVSNVVRLTEPTPTDFDAALKDISGKTLLVDFADLDKHPKCIDLLGEYVKNLEPGGKLIVVSREWDSHNTQKERELRKFCLFFQQNLPVEPKNK